MDTQHKSHRRRHEDSRPMDQAVLAGALWFIPLSLFGYVAYQISLATGSDPFAFLPAVEMWEIAFGAVAVIGVITLAVAWSRHAARSREEADEAYVEAGKR